MSERPSLSLSVLAAAYRAGAKPSDVARAVLAAEAAHADPAIWIGGPCTDRLLAQAAALDGEDPASLPLYGVPFAVKDNIDVAGLPTTAGCPAFGYTAEASAPVVAALEAAGAMLVGKTNLDQFATGLVGVRSPHGVPRNVLDPSRVPGGSSSGSAVAVAAGLVSFSLGTDTAGSGRVPAMANGIVGLKPTRGLLSTRGVVPACRSLDCVSVFAGSVEEAMAVLAVAAAFDAGDPFSRTAPPGWPGAGARARPRLGVPGEAGRVFFGHAAPAKAYARALERAALFAELVEVDYAPFAEAARLLYEGPWVAERTAVLEPLLASDPEAINPVVRGIVAKGLGLSAIETFRAQYRLAALKRAADAALAGLDALLLPTAPFVPTLADVAAEPVAVNAQLGAYTNFVNLLDLAALAVPAGTNEEGTAFGVTFVGAAFSEARLASLAARFSGEPSPAPRVAAWPTLEIVLFGAHMRGLPLNGDVQRLGARHLADVATAPAYRMLALPGTPARPGVVPAAAGAALAGEVWSFPAASVAALLASIPAPLSLGRVRLADGREVTGFLCTDPSPQGAEDITCFGGWRAYLAARAAS
ncbi:MAG: allophanate hydrolase [Acetobacteraceae bacterium]|jgi:allophanate hydrolase|nr:allophanate hydrolase [Acetobacteraceae bacterium]